MLEKLTPTYIKDLFQLRTWHITSWWQKALTIAGAPLVVGSMMLYSLGLIPLLTALPFLLPGLGLLYFASLTRLAKQTFVSNMLKVKQRLDRAGITPLQHACNSRNPAEFKQALAVLSDCGISNQALVEALIQTDGGNGSIIIGTAARRTDQQQKQCQLMRTQVIFAALRRANATLPNYRRLLAGTYDLVVDGNSRQIPIIRGYIASPDKFELLLQAVSAATNDDAAAVLTFLTEPLVPYQQAPLQHLIDVVVSVLTGAARQSNAKRNSLISLFDQLIRLGATGQQLADLLLARDSNDQRDPPHSLIEYIVKDRDLFQILFHDLHVRAPDLHGNYLLDKVISIAQPQTLLMTACQAPKGAVAGLLVLLNSLLPITAPENIEIVKNYLLSTVGDSPHEIGCTAMMLAIRTGVEDHITTLKQVYDRLGIDYLTREQRDHLATQGYLKVRIQTLLTPLGTPPTATAVAGQDQFSALFSQGLLQITRPANATATAPPPSASS